MEKVNVIRIIIGFIRHPFAYILEAKRRVGMFLIIRRVNQQHKKALMKLKNKRSFKCVFFALDKAIWKYDKIFELMRSNVRFEPIILVCPIVNYGKENMLTKMNECYNFFKSKGYDVIKSYDEGKNTYLNALDLSPDIIFYTNPYKGLIDDRYYITQFPNILTVYVPYFISTNTAYNMSFNEEMHNLVWRRYCETPLHKQFSIKYSDNRGQNVVLTGYPGIEGLINKKSDDCYLKTKKTIIWAPHHTIEPAYGVIFYSCFFLYQEFMLKMAKKYEDKVFFVFKPHPLLKEKLYSKWGKDKTIDYYMQWQQMKNTSLNEGEYIELFLESNAMIHDSASFIVEYLYTNKPVLRTLNGEDLQKQHSSFGLECIANHYLANSEQDIEQFIQNVINGIDPLKEQRTKFVNEVLMPKGSPSQNIIDDILDSIDNQILYRN